MERNTHHLASHKYIVAAIVLEFQQVVGLYVKIANSLEYRQAVKTAKQIDPRVYQETNERAKHIVSSMNNLIPGMTLGPFIIEPVACSLFYIAEKRTRKSSTRNLRTSPPFATPDETTVASEVDDATKVAPPSRH